MLDIHDPPKKLHISGGLNIKKEVRRCSRGSNGTFIRDDIYYLRKGLKTKADATLGEFSFFWRRAYGVYDFILSSSFAFSNCCLHAFSRTTNSKYDQHLLLANLREQTQED